MLVQRRVWKSLQAASAHCLLSSFTLLLALKLDHVVSHSWWFIFTPLWLFHCVTARDRCSLPIPSMSHDRHCAPPFHLLVAFEILLCVHLEDKFVDLKIVVLPLLAFEVAILIYNVRICRELMNDDEAIWEEALPHFLFSISMVFFIAGTTLTVLKLCGDLAGWGWWDLFKYFGIAECCAFLVCVKWSNQSIQWYSDIPEPSFSSMVVSYMDWNLGLVDIENQQSNRICGLQDIAGHVMKIPFITFQIILTMRLEGTRGFAKNIPILVLFVPLFLLQGAGVLFAIYMLVENDSYGRCYNAISSKIGEFLGFFQHVAARLLGWCSTDEGSSEEQARLHSGEATGYNTFSPEVVKKMPKSELVEEIWRLQAALSEQTDKQEEYERLQNEKILCRVCFEDAINVVLLPCRHHVLCSTCCEKCEKCPICRALILKCLLVYDV